MFAKKQRDNIRDFVPLHYQNRQPVRLTDTTKSPTGGVTVRFGRHVSLSSGSNGAGAERSRTTLGGMWIAVTPDKLSK